MNYENRNLALFLPQPADYHAALAEVNRLSEATPGTDDFDSLDVLATLVEAYEARVYPVAPPDPIEAFAIAIKRLGLSRRDLTPYIGASGRVCGILNRERRLTLPMMRRLYVGLSIPLGVLAQQYPLRASGDADSACRPGRKNNQTLKRSAA